MGTVVHLNIVHFIAISLSLFVWSAGVAQLKILVGLQ